jgi:hypothetical protein
MRGSKDKGLYQYMPITPCTDGTWCTSAKPLARLVFESNNMDEKAAQKTTRSWWNIMLGV